MSTMLEQMKSDLNDAMKLSRSENITVSEQAKLRMGAIRGAMTAVSAAATKGKSRVELDDSQVRDVLRKSVKSMNEAAEVYQGAGEVDRAVKERAEAEVLSAYLPQQFGEDETREAVETFVDAEGLRGSGMKSMGVVVKHFASDERYDKAIVAKFAKTLVA